MASVEHLERYQWKKGQSGNPSGPKKGLAKASREIVGDDGHKLAELWWSIASDETQRSGDRLEASRLLAERGWGKAATFTAQEGDPLGLEDAEQAAAEFRSKILQLAAAGDAGETDSGGGKADKSRR